MSVFVVKKGRNDNKSVTTMERVLQGKKEQEVVSKLFDKTSCCAQDETRTHRK